MSVSISLSRCALAALVLSIGGAFSASADETTRNSAATAARTTEPTTKPPTEPTTKPDADSPAPMPMTSAPMPAQAETAPTASSEAAEAALSWLDDYAAGLKAAEAARRPLVILFHNPADEARTARFEQETLRAGAVRDLLEHCTLAKLPHDYRIKAGGEEFELLKHASFAQLGGQVGMAVVDTVHRDSPQFRRVVAALPMTETPPSQEALVATLEKHLPEDVHAKLAALEWHEDYGEAIKRAERERRMLFIYFRNEARDAEQEQFEREALSNDRIRRKLGRFVLARLARNTEIKVQDQPVKLIEHASFSPMYGRQGIAIVDTTEPQSRNFRQVVSAFPFSPRKRYDARRLGVILDLPRGTLTQRTLIYAIRTHPEAPASTDGVLNKMLADEAESHSQYQADIDQQGHHNWGQRFQRISARLPGGMVAVEVCAESWPGEELVDAAEECVNSWRQSSGHWGAVSARQPFFGYDMKLGSRAVWYATGIFGRH